MGANEWTETSIAGLLSLLAFFLDLGTEESRYETLKDLFLGISFLAWYWGGFIVGLVFVAAAGIIYLPKAKKWRIRRRYR
ncbi:hypothetical protein E3E35_02200 [Thermococcus sp. GR7]|uniref:hypothetical protein n=1 Tax=unclassified Thermococcus TaxID=2627626 RepID=UPI00142F646B|nr:MULTISPECIES: hypothetical protein [unclassified Thermococcus]NJE46244.1 hypothetical protein [Thermococcus sp. GR7]NJE79498.1 hypothetical protein [Thermococcus sp. GR4]NJF23877.1 hypothetical protein [Thermococcus sp. GR5]